MTSNKNKGQLTMIILFALVVIVLANSKTITNEIVPPSSSSSSSIAFDYSREDIELWESQEVIDCINYELRSYMKSIGEMYDYELTGEVLTGHFDGEYATIEGERTIAFYFKSNVYENPGIRVYSDFTCSSDGGVMGIDNWLKLKERNKEQGHWEFIAEIDEDSDWGKRAIVSLTPNI